MKRKYILYNFCISIFLLSAFSCNAEVFSKKQMSPNYWPTNGWKTTTPEEQGMSSEKLLALLNFVNSGEFTKISDKETNRPEGINELNSIFIIRNGYSVLDTYFNPYTSDKKHHVFSVTKSVVSLLIGIAIDKGYINNVDQPVLNFFPKQKFKNMSKCKENMTLKNLLSMTTGLNLNDGKLNEFNKCVENSNWSQNILDLPMSANPGEKYIYSNLATYLLCAIIQKTTGQSVVEFADKFLFSPLGIKNYKCYLSPEGIFLGFEGLSITPHDLAKIGLLCLNHGKWNGKQIISSKWIDESTQKQSSPTEGLTSEYGYQWWLETDKPGLYIAWGAYGQLLIVDTNNNLIVVTTGNLPHNNPYELFKNFIVPAIKSNKPIKKNFNAYNELRKFEINLKSSPTVIANKKFLPKIATKISGKTYKMTIEDNIPFGKITFSFTKNHSFFKVDFIDNMTQVFEVNFEEQGKIKLGDNRLRITGLCTDTFDKRFLDLTFEDKNFKGTYWNINVFGQEIQE